MPLRRAMGQSSLGADDINSLIEQEVIPRLLVAHAGPEARRRPPRPSIAVDDALVAEFTEHAMILQADELLALVDGLLCQGMTPDVMLVDLLVPVARRIGTFWADDRADFMDVTMAMWRLQEVVHDLSRRGRDEHRHAGRRRAFFATMPGDHHSFGSIVLEEVFARGGWQTDRLNAAPTPELFEKIGGEWFDMIALTINCDYHIGPLSSVIAAVRNISRNPRICVMVGGRVFAEDPGLVVRVGADGTAPDARAAVAKAGRLVAAIERGAID